MIDQFSSFDRFISHCVDTPKMEFFDVINPKQNTVILIGPEGGWTDEEEKTILSHGYEAVSLGKQILRAETAALSGLAMVSHFWNL